MKNDLKLVEFLLKSDPEMSDSPEIEKLYEEMKDFYEKATDTDTENSEYWEELALNRQESISHALVLDKGEGLELDDFKPPNYH